MGQVPPRSSPPYPDAHEGETLKMAAMKTYRFQEKAIRETTDMVLEMADNPRITDNLNRNVLLVSFVGSGKTYMMARITSEVMKQGAWAAIVISPGNGGLAEQNMGKMREYGLARRVMGVQDAVRVGISADDVVCVNWEKLKNDDKNRVRRGGDEPTIDERIEEAVSAGIRILVIVDEAHLGGTPKAREVLRMLHPSAILDVSATPNDYGQRMSGMNMCEVDIEDVIQSGLIKPRIVLNAGLRSSSDEGIIKACMEKRGQIEERLRERGNRIVPLALIQLENVSNKESVTVADDVCRILKENGAEDADIAVWLAKDKRNLDDIADSSVRFLVFKQSVATGWDAPRAWVLGRLRDVKSPNFDVQTLGRTMRNPDKEAYGDPLLDAAYFYSAREKVSFTLGERERRALGAPSRGFTASFVAAPSAVTLPGYVRSEAVPEIPSPRELADAVCKAIGRRFPLRERQMTDAVASGSVSLRDIAEQETDGDGRDGTTADGGIRSVRVFVDSQTTSRRAARVLAKFPDTVAHVVRRVLGGERPSGDAMSASEYADAVIVQNANAIASALRDMVTGFPGGADEFEERSWVPPTTATYARMADATAPNYAYDAEPDLSLDATGSSSEEPFGRWMANPSNGFSLWLKNGTSCHDLAIPYADANGVERLFYPDFVGVRGSQLWVVDVKAPMFEGDREDVPAKLAAMRRYEGEHAKALLATYPGGLHMEVVKWNSRDGQPYTLHGGAWCGDATDTQAWRPMLEGM